MRTTITIDERLLTDAKRRASETGSTVSRVIADSLRLTLYSQPSSEDEEGFELVTYGRGGSFSNYNLDKTSAIIEMEDRERFGSGKR